MKNIQVKEIGAINYIRSVSHFILLLLQPEPLFGALHKSCNDKIHACLSIFLPCVITQFKLRSTHLSLDYI